MAGEVVAVGEDVTEWKVGDRVCPNFSPAHIYGDPTPEIQEAALGAVAHGVLTEYKAFYPYVCFLPIFSLLFANHLLLVARQDPRPSVLRRSFYIAVSLWVLCQCQRRSSSLLDYSCAGLTAYNALLGAIPLKGGDVVVVQGTGGVSMYV